MENKKDDETDSDEEYIDYFTWLDENRRQSKRLCLENRRGKFYEHTNQFLNNFHTIVPVLGDYLVLEDVIQLIKSSKGLKTFMYETRSPAMKDFWNLLGIRFFPNCKVKHGLSLGQAALFPLQLFRGHSTLQNIRVISFKAI